MSKYSTFRYFFVLLLLLCFVIFNAKAQNVVRIEYFVDTDPGFGKGNNVPLAPGQDITANFQININTLSVGFHNIYVRGLVNPYQVTEDGKPVTKGGWSLSAIRSFYKENITSVATPVPNIIAGEYFVDTDPGFGKGINIPVTPGTNISNVSFAFDITALSIGFHSLHVRFKDGNSNWSLCNTRNFYKESVSTGNTNLLNITKGEYFIDTDPGFGNANNIPVVAGSDINNLSFTFDITSLPAGFHNLFVRFRDARGAWSTCNVRNFYKENISTGGNALPNIVGGEFFIDADPGFGKGINIPITPGVDLTNVSYAINITGISIGFHQISTRFRDANGRWSHTNRRSFYKESFTSLPPLSNIVKLEYFIDTVKDFGKGKNVAITPGTNINNVAFEVDMAGVPIGHHQLYVRAQNADGVWSLISTSSFKVEAPSGFFITVGSVKETLCTGGTVSIPFTVSSTFNAENIFTAQLSDNNGGFTNPVNIGTLEGNTSGTINAEIPSYITPGTGYRIRILASLPKDTSAANDSMLTINRTPNVFSIGGDTVSCLGTKIYNLINTEPGHTAKYTWSLVSGGTMDTSGTRASINWSTPGVHNITVKYTGICAGSDSVKALSVRIINTPLSGTFMNMLPENGNINLSLPVTFSWLPIENAILYDLYIWEETGQKPVTPTIADINGINYTVTSTSILQYEKNYNWQVVAKRDCFKLESAEQTFRLRLLPDLLVNNIQIPASGFSGQSFSVNWEVKNIGQGGTLQMQWFDNVYLSNDPILEASTDFHLGTVSNISELAPGNSYVQTVSFTIPQGINDNFYVFVITDEYNQLIEPDKTNNSRISNTTSFIQLTPPPDLSVTSIVPPNFVFSGQTMDVNWRVTNSGTGPTASENWIDRVYLSKDTILDISKAVLLGDFSHSGMLNERQNYLQNATLKVPDGIFGSYYLFVLTDIFNSVYEHASENNNRTRTDSISIILTPPIDLVVTQFTAPVKASNKETVSLEWSVENQGGSSIEAGHVWSDIIYMSKVDSFNLDSAILVGNFRRSTAIQPGEGYNATQNITIPGKITGDYYLYVYTDAAKSIFEYTNESNNIRRSNGIVRIDAPDLVVSEMTTPSAGNSGTPVQLEWKIKNNAAGTLFNTIVTDRILISSKPEFNPVDVTEIIQLSYESGELLPDSVISKKVSVNLPHGISGNYYLYIQTDYTNTVDETGHENNNIKRSSSFMTITLSPWPDLQITNVQTTDTATAGDVIALTFKGINKGVNAVDIPWQDNVYISTKRDWDSSKAIYVRDFSQTKVLGKDSLYTVNSSIRIPPQVGDSLYYVFVYADARNNIYEHTEEGNNTRRSDSIYIKKYPPIDLAVNGITGPGAGSSGKPITVSWTVLNKSEIITLQTQWVDALYLSADTVWDASNDIFVKDFIHSGALDSNKTYSNQQSFTLPNGISGSYYLLLVADYIDFNKDADRKNNYKLVTNETGGEPVKIDIILTPPSDLIVTSLNVPGIGTAGQPLTISWKVKNAGTGITASKSWTEEIYLSANNTIDAKDIAIGSYVRMDSLAAGQEYTDSVQAFLPVDASGNFWIIFKTDGNDNVYEHNAEQNNTVTSLINIVRPLLSDLLVSDIAVPANAIAGEPVTIQWKVKNTGAFPATGYMKEGIYLSEDTAKNVSDVLLTAQETSFTLAPQAEISNSFTGELKGASIKDYHVLVHTDVLNNIYESSDNNNVSASLQKLKVTVPLLPINVLTQNNLIPNKEIYYRIEVPDSLDGESLLVTLKADSLQGANELYLRYGEVPTRAVYDYSHSQPFEGNQEIVIPELKPGTYYLMVYGNTTAGITQEASLLAKILNFEIRNVNASKGGNTGQVTLQIGGSKLGNLIELRLVRSDSIIIDAEKITVIDPTKVFATFNLKGATVGNYNVVAINARGETAEFKNGFAIVAGAATNLLTNVVTPASTRPSNIISLTVQYTNGGNTDIINPVIKLSSLGGAPIGFNVSDLVNETKTLILSLQEVNGPVGVLRPGASGIITIYAKATAALSFVLLQ